MRTGRLAGVAINQTVCSRRIRRHFFPGVWEIQLAPILPIVRFLAIIHPPTAAVFFFNLNQLTRENF
jgi:hypothetical protein